jgi:carbonic anhydrase
MVIACSDSRVDPTQIFDVPPGRDVRRPQRRQSGAAVRDGRQGHHGVSAALEFALTQLKVPEIVVMGHGACGGVGAALSQAFLGQAPGAAASSPIGSICWTRRATASSPSMAPGAEAIRALELESVKVSLANLRSFPSVPEREAAGELKLHGAYFAIADGKLHLLDETTGEFAPADL